MLAKVPGGERFDFVTLPSVTIPSTLLGVLAIGTFSWFRGKDLARDGEFQARITDPETKKYVYRESKSLLGATLSGSQWAAGPCRWCSRSRCSCCWPAPSSAAACHGYYILPTYPSDLAAIQFDRSGTTRIGKYVINHSFILPGLIGVITSCLFGCLMAAGRGML